MLDSFLEDESLFGEFLRAPVSEGGVEPLVVEPPHVVVEVAPQLLDRGVAVPVHELLLQQPVRRLDHGVVIGVALAGKGSFDAEHVEQLVDSRVVELASTVGAEHLDVRPGGAAVADGLYPAPRGRSRDVVLGPGLPGWFAVRVQLHDLPLERLIVVMGMFRVGHHWPPIPCHSSLIGLSNTL